MTRRWPLIAVLVGLSALTLPSAGLAIQIRTSLTAVQADVMCVACHEPLAVAQSPQAASERSYIQLLIGRGETKAEIERQLVAQYGPSVLAKPPAQGFSLSLYILPPALVAIGVVILLVTLPRWRRRSAAQAAGAANPAPALSLAEAQRLDDELRSFGG